MAPVMARAKVPSWLARGLLRHRQLGPYAAMLSVAEPMVRRRAGQVG